MFAIDFLESDMQKKMGYGDLINMVTLLKKYGVITEWSYIENVTSCIVLFLPYIIEVAQIDMLLEKLELTFKRIIA